MTLEENRADLERHARDFAARSGFTYTVLDPSDRSVIGCARLTPTATSRFESLSRAGSSRMAIQADRIRRAGVGAQDNPLPRAGVRTNAPLRAKERSRVAKVGVVGPEGGLRGT